MNEMDEANEMSEMNEIEEEEREYRNQIEEENVQDLTVPYPTNLLVFLGCIWN